jgi:hypothetical protein
VRIIGESDESEAIVGIGLRCLYRKKVVIRQNEAEGQSIVMSWLREEFGAIQLMWEFTSKLGTWCMVTDKMPKCCLGVASVHK